MEKVNKIKALSLFLLVGAALFYAGTAPAGFFVVPFEIKSDEYVLVRAEGTDLENGAALISALAEITDASESNPYLIVLEPGIYDIGSTALQMKEYVDIRGFGQDLTTIKGNVEGGGNPPTTGVINGANHSELRQLKVEHTGGVTRAVAVFNQNVTGTFKMTEMTAEASGGTNNYGVYTNNASPTMDGVTVAASGGNNSYGVYSYENSAPTMSNMTTTASGGGSNYGVYVDIVSSINMNKVTAEGSGGTNNYGVYVKGGADH